MKKKFWKWWILPSPSELGMTGDSTYEALSMRGFANPGEPTWEDWEEIVQKKYPIRFFLTEEVVPWFRRKFRRIVKDPIYWFKCHFIPKHKYHLLDLRQPKIKGEYNYRYGWIDSDTQMVFALFGILNKFVECEMKHWFCPSEEDVQADPSLLNQRNNYLEAKNIHYWWNIERKRQEKAHTDMLTAWSDAKHGGDPSEHQLWLDLHKLDQANQDKEDEIIARLLKIRRSLWT